MTIGEYLPLAAACAAGLLLGAIFFGGLWWTLHRGLSSSRPAIWLFSGLMLRMSIVLAGFYFVSSHRWERLLACLLGFVIARFVATSLIRPSVAARSPRPHEVEHAPQP
jgi:F1F0 ATPase subunit 2